MLKIVQLIKRTVIIFIKVTKNDIIYCMIIGEMLFTLTHTLIPHVFKVKHFLCLLIMILQTLWFKIRFLL